MLLLYSCHQTMIYHRIIRLADTDSAGVIYFATGLSLCHEAYEAALQAQGIDLKTFFQGRAIAAPIVHGEIDFLRPVYCGDRVIIQLAPQQTGESRFEILYQITSPLAPDEILIQAKTIHLCINPETRKKMPLTPVLQGWLTHFHQEPNKKP
jgi:1,4-dihydroxy-2-naphthoyl-CoA hydrolase